jgi:hypothetical protein
VVTAVAVVDVLNDFLTTVGLDVDVDVGGPSRSGERNRSNNSPSDTASALVMPSAKQTAEFAAEPRP